MNEHNIEKEDFWNMNETRVRIGVGRGQWVIVPDGSGKKGRFTSITGSHRGLRKVNIGSFSLIDMNPISLGLLLNISTTEGC